MSEIAEVFLKEDGNHVQEGKSEKRYRGLVVLGNRELFRTPSLPKEEAQHQAMEALAAIKKGLYPGEVSLERQAPHKRAARLYPQVEELFPETRPALKSTQRAKKTSPLI